jgi:hypothetical protein
MTQLTTAILDPSNVHSRDLTAAYELWLTVWQKTFKELGKSSLIPSDDFSRQDEIVALFDGPTCAALSFGRIVDMDSSIARHDSYFDAWLFADTVHLKQTGSLVYISSYFTVAEEYRGSAAKHELMRALIRQFECSRADVLAATTRNARGVNKLVARYGFETIRTGAVMHGADVDLMAYFRGQK